MKTRKEIMAAGLLLAKTGLALPENEAYPLLQCSVAVAITTLLWVNDEETGDLHESEPPASQFIRMLLEQVPSGKA
jgi:hypothetical protein